MIVMPIFITWSATIVLQLFLLGAIEKPFENTIKTCIKNDIKSNAFLAKLSISDESSLGMTKLHLHIFQSSTSSALYSGSDKFGAQNLNIKNYVYDSSCSLTQKMNKVILWFNGNLTRLNYQMVNQRQELFVVFTHSAAIFIGF